MRNYWKRRRPFTRRLVRWTAVAVALVLLIGAVWLLDLLRPRHSHFVERRGNLAGTEITAEETAVLGFRSTTVVARADTGLEVTFRVLRPADSDGPLPLMVLLGGHRTGRRAVELVGDPGQLAVAALDYPYRGPEKIRNVRQGLASIGEIQLALLDTPPAVSVALDWLIGQPWVDRDRVELVGVSLGAPFAAVAGALDERFRRVWILHGGADNRAWLENTLGRKIQSPLLRAAAARMLHQIAHGASFDTAEWIAKIAPRPVVVVGAEADESLSRENITSLYAAAGEPKELIWTAGGHVRPNRPEIVRELLHIVRERLPGDVLPQ